MRSGEIKSSYFLLALSLGICSVYFYFFSFIDSTYSPYYGDEFFYFKNAEAFFRTSHLQAVFSYSGKGSSLLGVDAHGPAYPILYGGAAKFLGWFGPLIPIINFTFLTIALLILILQKESNFQTKYLQLILVLGSPITLFYSFSFMPELLQIAGAIFLFIQFKRFFKSPDNRSLILLIALIVLLGAIRSTWFFALVALMVQPKSIQWKTGLILLPLALGMAYISQVLFHEPVPNTFSGIGELIRSGDYSDVGLALFYNLKRNIYFALTYSEGKFYTLQKIWMALTVLLALLIFRKEKLIQVGLLMFGLIFIFNMVLYKNYNWVEFRMYTPMILFLNLAMIASQQKKIVSRGLLTVGLLSFIMIVPFTFQVMDFRIKQETETIPELTIKALLKLDRPLILVDTLILKRFALEQLPISNVENRPIQYILPFYEIDLKKPSHKLYLHGNQLKVKSIKVLNQ